MLQQQTQGSNDERMVELIAARVTTALRADIEALLTAFAPQQKLTQSLTVLQLAARLGVARSTVYAHWREWGGYKLGAGPKAPIRFNAGQLPAARDDASNSAAGDAQPSPKRPKRRRNRRELIQDAPRLTEPEALLDGHR
jgi:hypothetical protein